MSTQKPEDSKRPLALTVITPDAVPVTAECDSVHLTAADGIKGEPGGLYGIRRGHLPAVMALSDGKLEAFLMGKAVLKAVCAKGFARIEGNEVTVITESFRTADSPEAAAR